MAKAKPESKIKRRKVHFSVESSGAGEVFLMGDFNNWDAKAHPMKRNGNGLWGKSVIIAPGKYEYKFLIDGNWKVDPKNEQTCPNCFGTFNSVLNLS